MATRNDLTIEILKKIQTDVSAIKADLVDVKAIHLRMREDFHRFEGIFCGSKESRRDLN